MGKNVIIWSVIILSLFMMFSGLNQNTLDKREQKISLSEFMTKLENKKVTEAKVRGNNISAFLSDGNTVSTYYPVDSNFIDKLYQNAGTVNIISPDDEPGLLMRILLTYLPTILFIGIMYFFYRQMQSGSGKAMSFGRSKAKMRNEDVANISFNDVAGIDEAKEEVKEIVMFLRNPSKFRKLGAKIPKGVLLVGPPGTGKTLLAKAIASEASVPFFSISGSDFVEMFVGVGASRVRDMFENGKRHAPCLIFIDELDAVGRHRGFGIGGGNDEREQTLNQLLVEMDGFAPNENIIILAATNRVDVLDPALLRPGRFDRRVYISAPDMKGRTKILKVHSKKVTLADDVDLGVISRGIPGFTGADIANLVNEAAIMAAKAGQKSITMKDFESSKDKIIMGAERKTMTMGKKEREVTAYHEAGHAIVAINCNVSDPIHKATIIPRGGALGMVVRLPEKDKISLSKEQAECDIAVAMGGRIAEEIIFGKDKITSGASSDIKAATNIARKMVFEWGMSEKAGMICYNGDHNEEVKISDDKRKILDDEVQKIVDHYYNQAKDILKEKNNDLHTLAKALLEYETLSGDEIKRVLNGEKLEIETKQKIEEKQKAKPKHKRTVPGVKAKSTKEPLPV